MQPAAADQVRVAEMSHHVPRGGVLAELLHDPKPRASDKSGTGPRTALADHSPDGRTAVEGHL
ncbi:hypothetical protein GCM10011376_11100 [Nocardioides flavus (ex Wang et al. 2016)]|uniref:Uncharacterized protein n=1 Tax=Nocardioides flavus (ex Wang et al. 2016) TaxID=2058780 RepID=A0ABQ3HKY9_9ACTN|nr:hypothetical protein GCM10011376_11100 [Nocardioides flavus (ex Wang et al. 2016)]